MATIAIIGAGMAGSAAATVLQRDGHQVTVFDKSRGSGGRISSRRTVMGPVDHGTPYFELTRPETLRFLQPALDSCALQWWRPRVVSFTAQGMMQQKEMQVLVGYPTMSSLTRFLLQGVELLPETRITSAIRTVDGWTLQGDDGRLFSGYDLLIITTPPLQALPLLQETPQLQQLVCQAEMECSWVAVVQSEQVSAPPYEVALFEQGALCRAVRHDAKPGRCYGTVWQLQASSAWSRGHQELPKEEAAVRLVEAAKTAGITVPDQYQVWAHRWLYGFTARPVGVPCIYDASAGLGVCGDWLLGRGVEDALFSALQLVEKIQEVDHVHD